MPSDGRETPDDGLDPSDPAVAALIQGASGLSSAFPLSFQETFGDRLLSNKDKNSFLSTGNTGAKGTFITSFMRSEHTRTTGLL